MPGAEAHHKPELKQLPYGSEYPRPTCPSACLSVYVPAHLFIYLSTYLSICSGECRRSPALYLVAQATDLVYSLNLKAGIIYSLSRVGTVCTSGSTVHICIHMWVHSCTCMHVCMHACMHTCVHAFIHTHIFVYIYIETYTYLSIYLSTYLRLQPCESRGRPQVAPVLCSHGRLELASRQLELPLSELPKALTKERLILSSYSSSSICFFFFSGMVIVSTCPIGPGRTLWQGVGSRASAEAFPPRKVLRLVDVDQDATKGPHTQNLQVTLERKGQPELCQSLTVNCPIGWKPCASCCRMPCLVNTSPLQVLIIRPHEALSKSPTPQIMILGKRPKTIWNPD